MQMADKPDDSDSERNQKKEKNDPAFPALFAQRTRSPICVERLACLERYRNLKPFVAVITSCGLFLSPRWRFVLRARPSRRDHALELVELFAQVSFLSCYLLLPVAKRRGRSARTTKHRHHLLAIQKKIASATAPKIISGKVRARPISNH
jgi:hypothetical protein